MSVSFSMIQDKIYMYVHVYAITEHNPTSAGEPKTEIPVDLCHFELLIKPGNGKESFFMKWEPAKYGPIAKFKTPG